MEIRGIELGPFELVRPLGSSPSSEVYVGLFGAIPVAVKVFTGDQARRQAALIAHAARRAATLAHPGIAVVLDYGLVPELADERSDGRLPRGAPYVVTELGRGAVNHDPRRTWPTIRRLLLRVLDVLAYAHARGVVHRSVQPSNVIAFPDAGPKLVDFGLTGAFEAPRARGVPGNPAYQAPEHLAGDARDIGPATDLYSLGCLAWEQVTGNPPFQATGPRDWRRAHRLRPPPPLTAQVQVPPGLEDWLRRLLAKDPGDRFRSAALATSELLAMEPNEGLGSALVTLAPLLDSPSHEPSAASPPVVPSTWRPDIPPTEPRTLAAGLALYGLRQPNVLGHEAPRELLWTALTQVASSRTPRLVLLRGPAGAGKSRLARWLLERCHELGVGRTLAAVHGYPRGPWDGVVSALEQRLGCKGLSRPMMAARLERIVRPQPLREQALQLFCPGPAPPAASTADRIEVIRDLLGALPGADPVVLWLDDGYHDPDAVALTERILEGSQPALVLLTARDHALSRLPDRGARVRALAQHPRAQTIEVGPMERGEPAALVSQLLGVPSQVAARVEAHTHGSPLAAEQLACDWVARGLITQGKGGLEFDEHATPPAHAALDDLWQARLKDFLGRQSHGSRLALELAAILGRRVDDDEWGAVCAKAGVRRQQGLPAALERARLASRHGNSWSFRHNTLTEAIRAEARATRRISRHQTRIASVLLAAGRTELDRGRPRQASELLYRALQLAEEDRSGWARVLVVLAESQLALGRLDDAAVGLETALDIHRSDGDRTFEGLTLSTLGTVRRAQGLNQEGRDHFQQAIRIFSELRYTVGLGRALDELATLEGPTDSGRARALHARAIEAHRETQDVDRQIAALRALARLEDQDDLANDARAHLLEARDLARARADLLAEGEILEALGDLLLRRGNLSDGLQWLRTGLTIAGRSGDHRTESRLLVALGQAEHHAGDLVAAAEHYGRARGLLARLGDGSGAARVRGLLGEVLTLRGDLRGAIEALSQAAAEHDKQGDEGAEAAACCQLADLHRIQGRLEEARDLYERALAVAQRLGAMGTEARALRGIGELARLGSAPSAAEASLRTAIALFGVEGQIRQEAETLISLGDLLREAGSFDDAAEALGDARARCADLGDSSLTAECLAALACLESDRGTDAVHDTLALALASLPQDASPLAAAVVHLRRARVALHLGARDETWDALTVATKLAVQLDTRPASALARALDQLTRQAERLPRSPS